MSEKYDRVLVRGVNWIGDAVMTMPALRALKKALPESKISLLVKPWVASLFEKDPHIDEIILYGEEYTGLRGRRRLLKALRSKRFSLAILLQNAFNAALTAFLAGIPERAGYARDMRGFLLTMPVPFNGQDRKIHHIEYYLNLLRQAGIRADYSEPWLYLDISERLHAREAFSDMRRPLLGLNPGATYGSAKRWQAERFAAVALRFIEEVDGSAVVFGGKSEEGIAAEIVSLCDRKGRIVSLAGRTTLRELAASVSECDVFLTNDSGPMHVCYAVRTPLVAVFGSTEPSLSGPPTKGNIVLKKDIPCSPCFDRECLEGSLKCMDAIDVPEVFEAIKGLVPQGRAVFFDRDGTLCRDADFLNKWDDFEVFPEIGELRRLKEKGFKLIGVSNQSGISRGLVEENFAKKVNDVFIEKYGFDGFYYCPHHPDDYCSCRKPEPGMALTARIKHGIDLKRSYVVGDKEADLLLAKAVGAKAVLVLTGQAKGSENAD
ncbi:MAG: lipopolysaccharide heptosyltransferase II, partial [Thermodesulfovibrionales bacterium]|nr:lipopolysaccharide heptosyltransferase II [Thermodesulfovibrionales bacterium]